MSSLPSLASVSLSLSLLRPHDHTSVLDTLQRFCEDQHNDLMKPLSAYPLPAGSLVDVLRLIGEPQESIAQSSVPEQLVIFLEWYDVVKPLADPVAYATSTLAMINEVLKLHGLSVLGWMGDLDSSTHSYSNIHFSTKRLSLSKYLLRKASPELLRDIVILRVAEILCPDNPHQKAMELGWKNLPRPRHVVDRTERRWILECPDCHKREFRNVVTRKVKRLVCSVDRKPWVITRNPAFVKDTVVMRGRKRAKKRNLSGAPPECYDSDGAYLG